MVKKLNNKGFTIVEVLIVLAIAGAILAAILIAVPALQRNSRNTKVRSAANSLASGFSEATSANSGTAPTAGTWATPNFTWTGANAVVTKVGAGLTVSTAAVPTTFTASSLYVEFGQVCSGNTATSTGATSSNVAIVYAVETGGTVGSACVQG